MGLLQQQLGPYTIGWLVISVLGGGILGALIKYLFETRLTEQFRSKQQAFQAIRKYSYPLLLAANDVELRIERILSIGIKRDWLSSEVVQKVQEGKGFLSNPSEEKGYFYLSTLYVFARYFAWLQIFIQAVGHLDAPPSKELRELTGILARICNSFRIPDIWGEDGRQTKERPTLYRHIQTALGETMIVRRDNDWDCLSFREFVGKYKEPSNEWFRFWFDNLDKYYVDLCNIDIEQIDQVEPNRDRYRILRLVVLQYWFYKLVRFLDKDYKRVQKRKPDHEEIILGRLPNKYKDVVNNIPEED